MNNDSRIIELLTEMLFEQRTTNTRLEKMESQQAKTNLAIDELRLSVMQLAEKFEIVSQLDKRVTRIEEVVFHA